VEANTATNDNYGFKFRIGDVLEFVHKLNDNCKMLVLERLLQECSGGIQRSYLVRCISERMIDREAIRVNEIELQRIVPAVEDMIQKMKSWKEHFVEAPEFDMIEHVRKLQLDLEVYADRAERLKKEAGK